MNKTPLILLSLFILLTGCDIGPESPRGFSLPVGDVTKGKAVFEKLGCSTCHTLKGVQIREIEKHPEISVVLGGEVSRIKTYAELVTSIINPSHRIAKSYPLDKVENNGASRMRIYNDVMTVTELIDLVSFLQPHYTLKKYAPTPYTGF